MIRKATDERVIRRRVEVQEVDVLVTQTGMKHDRVMH